MSFLNRMVENRKARVEARADIRRIRAEGRADAKEIRAGGREAVAEMRQRRRDMGGGFNTFAGGIVDNIAGIFGAKAGAESQVYGTILVGVGAIVLVGGVLYVASRR